MTRSVWLVLPGALTLAVSAQAMTQQLIAPADARVGVSFSMLASSPEVQMVPDDPVVAARYTDAVLRYDYTELQRSEVDQGLDLSTQFVDDWGQAWAQRVTEVTVREQITAEYGTYDLLEWFGSFTAPADGSSHWLQTQLTLTGDVRDGQFHMEGLLGRYTYPRTGVSRVVRPSVSFGLLPPGAMSYVNDSDQRWSAGVYDIHAPGSLSVSLEHATSGRGQRFALTLYSAYADIWSQTYENTYSYTYESWERVPEVPEVPVPAMALVGAGLAALAVRRRRAPAGSAQQP